MVLIRCVFFLVTAGCFVDAIGEATSGTGGQGGSTSSTGGMGETSTNTTGGFGGEAGSNGGSPTTGGQGGLGNGGSETGGQGGEGGGAGGTPTCMDPPEPNALTILCNEGCNKILISDGGVAVDAESSPDDSLCEDLPFTTHPLPGQYALVWVYDPATNNGFTAKSLGSFPSACWVKCPVNPPNPGPAPDHSQMLTEFGNGGYTQITCGTAPDLSLFFPCVNGMHAALEY